MNEKLYQYIKDKFSIVETEIWNFNNNDTGIVDPTLRAHTSLGIGLYLVPTQQGLLGSVEINDIFVIISEINQSSPKAANNIILNQLFEMKTVSKITGK